MRNIDEMKRKRKAIWEEMRALTAKAGTENRTLTEEEDKRFSELETEHDRWGKEIEREERLQALEAAGGPGPGTGPAGGAIKPDVNDNPGPSVRMTEGPPRPYKNLVHQLRAVKQAAFGQMDDGLQTLMNAEQRALGMNVSVGTEGGFAVQTDFAGMLMESAAKAGNILPLVDSYTVTDGSNSVKWVEVEETDVSTTVFGGVQVYWAAEAAAVAASNPKLQEREMKLEKLMGLFYATYELESDSNFVNDLVNRSFTLAIQRTLESAIVSGSGKGQPLGFLKGPALVIVPKESGQVAGTILWDNLSKMYHRLIEKNWGIWVAHPDAHEQFDFLSFPVGTGGVPVYLPATQVGSVNTLRGRPIVESDHCSQLGTQGDICYIDPKAYMLALKGGIDVATSIHVQFLTAQNAFRFIFRVNGQPKMRSALTIKNSSKQRSNYITLATRV